MTDITGYVEQVTRQFVRGWAYDAADPARPLLIEVLIDGRVVAVGPTDQPRADLARADTGRDTFGFTISLPDGVSIELHRMAVRVAVSGAPIPMTDDAGGYEGFVEVFEGGSLKGWGWRCGYPAERVRILVRHKGELVGSSLANQLRPDLIGAGVGDGRHAFLIALPMLQKQLDPAHLYAEFEATGAPLTDLRYPDRAPPPKAVEPPRPEPRPAEPSIAKAPAPTPIVARAAVRPVTPVKAPIAARPPMTRMPMARPTKAPVAGPPAAAPRIAPKRPVMPQATVPAPAAEVKAAPPVAPATLPPATVAPVEKPPVEQPPVAAAPAPVTLPQPTLAPPPPPPPPAPAPVAAQPAPPAPAPAPPTPTISKELYEALRGSLNFGDEGGLF